MLTIAVEVRVDGHPGAVVVGEAPLDVDVGVGGVEGVERDNERRTIFLDEHLYERSGGCRGTPDVAGELAGRKVLVNDDAAPSADGGGRASMFETPVKRDHPWVARVGRGHERRWGKVGGKEACTNVNILCGAAQIWSASNLLFFLDILKYRNSQK